MRQSRRSAAYDPIRHGRAQPSDRAGRNDTNKLVLLDWSPHSREMAKTWVSKNVTKLQKAFVKAMRQMKMSKNRRNFSGSR
jgi:hypothetical protein